MLLLFFAITKKSFSQSDGLSSNVNKELLWAFARIKNGLPIHIEQGCPINKKWTFEETLDHAWQYNQEGNWRCCEDLLAALSNKSGKLSAIDKLHLLLVRADYLYSHQLLDSSYLVASIANQEAGKNEWLPEKTRALLLLSYGALKQRNISSAYDWADSALQLSRKTHNKLLEGKALLQMAFCARRNFTSSSHRAFPYYLEADDVAETTGDSLTLFYSSMYFADDNFEIEQWSEGLPYFKKAIEIAIKSDDVYLAFTAYTGVGFPLVKQGYAKEALVLYKQALALSQQQKMPYNTQNSYLEVAGTFQELKQYDSALLYANYAASVPGIDSLWANMWQLKASIYKDMGNYKMATEMYAKALDFAKEDFLYRNQDQLSGYEASLQTKEKELQVVQGKKLSIELEWMVGGVAILLLMAAWAYILQRRDRQKLSTQNAIIEKQRANLEKSLSEKDMLLKEIHHRVKNNLAVISSLLELQSSGMDDVKAKAAIAEGQNRVQSIALIHQRLYQHENLAAIEFSGFVEDMIRQVSSVFQMPGQKIKTDIQMPETLLDIDTAVPLGLIMNELLTNSFKYAFTGNIEGLIRIRLSSPGPGNYSLTYSDNGPGMPNGFELKKNKSLGLRLIHRLSKQLGGSAEHLSHEGCMFVIQFKDAVTRNQEA